MLRCGCQVAVSVFGSQPNTTQQEQSAPNRPAGLRRRRGAEGAGLSACCASSASASLRSHAEACMQVTRACLRFPCPGVCVCLCLCVLRPSLCSCCVLGLAQRTCKWLQALIKKAPTQPTDRKTALLHGEHCPLHRASVPMLHHERSTREKQLGVFGWLQLCTAHTVGRGSKGAAGWSLWRWRGARVSQAESFCAWAGGSLPWGVHVAYMYHVV